MFSLKCSVNHTGDIVTHGLPRWLVKNIDTHRKNVCKTIPDDQLVDSHPPLFSYHYSSLQVYQGGDGQDKDIRPETELSEALVSTKMVTSYLHRVHSFVHHQKVMTFFFEISKKISTELLVTSFSVGVLKATKSASLGWEHSFGSNPSNQIRARHIWQIDLHNIFREKNVSDYGAMILIELHLIDNFFQTLSLKHNLGQYLQYSPLLLTFLNFCARNWLSKQIQKDKKLTNPFFPDPNTPLTHFNDYKAEFEE